MDDKVTTQTDGTSSEEKDKDSLAPGPESLTTLFTQLKTHIEQDPNAGPQVESQYMSYFRRQAARMAQSYFSGNCRVCNNLQAHGHEDSSTATHEALNPWGTYVKGGELKDSAEAARTTASLFLDGIKLEDLLQSRTWRDVGRWENDCRYCRFLCDVLDAVYFNWVWTQQRGFAYKRIALTIREGFPLVLTTRNFTHRSPGAGYREDLDIYQHPLGICDPIVERRARQWNEAEAKDGKGKGKMKEGVPAKTQTRPTDSDEGEKAKEQLPSQPELLSIFGLALPRLKSSDSEECFNLIADYYRDCQENHPLCANIDFKLAGFVPTRLLYIGGSDIDLRICENLDSDPETGVNPVWAALSHCWGGGQGIHKLTTASLEDMKILVDHAVLPATFQDAIRVVRMLRVRYIWIDSLCIIQDSRLDWEIEAAQMGNVYACATLVVSGANAMNPTINVLRDRQCRFPALGLDFEAKDGTTHEVFVRKRQAWTADVTQGLKEPPYTSAWAMLPPFKALQSRAWVFQEEFLSRRNIFFEEEGLVWKCKTHQRMEGYLPPHADLRDGTLGEVHVDRKWHQMVKAYSCRNLSFPTDRLPAISGVAALVAEWKKEHWQKSPSDGTHASQNYLAGLWRNSLVPDLLWATMPGSSHRPLTYSKDTYTAPSWSWASVSHGVVWTAFPDLESLSAPTHAVVALREPAEGSSKPANPYGEVTDGVIAYRTRKLRCWVTYDPREREYFMHFDRPDGTSSSKKWFRSDGLLIPVAMRLKPKEGEEEGESVNCLRRAYPGENDSGLVGIKATAWFLCLAKTSPMQFDHIGLVLGNSAFPGRTGRVGFASNIPREWWEHGTGEDKVGFLS